MEQQDGPRVSTTYIRFAEDEARDRSPLYAELSRGVASDPEVIGLLLTLPREKRQPNLFLSAARHLFGTPTGWDQFRSGILENKDALRAAMLARSTQTNEPGRCAALLPILARLPEPLALLEVGASAGLCLLPDFYAYDYGGAILGPEAQRLTPPVFPCAVNAATPVPARLPRVVWRRGSISSPSTSRTLARWLGWKHSCGRSRRVGWQDCARRSRLPPSRSRGSSRATCARTSQRSPGRRRGTRHSSSFIRRCWSTSPRRPSGRSSRKPSARSATIGSRTKHRGSFRTSLGALAGRDRKELS